MTTSDTPTVTSVGADQAAIEHHYDVGNDFYALWLDDAMVYSCAMFEGDDDTIDAAQQRKLQYYVDRLRLPEGGRLLDVGCGWGGMLAAAGRADPSASLSGLTLSPSQAAEARGRLGPAAEIHLGAWQDHRPESSYDSIVSLGAFEHFVRTGLSRPERVVGYGDFFRAAWSWLSGPQRRLCLQTIALEDQEEQVGSGLGEFFTNAVFPASSLPRIGEVVEAAEPWFRLIEMRADPDDYARSCREWRTRLQARREEAEAASDVATVRHYRKTLFAAEMEFATRSSTLYRFTFEARDREVSTARGLP